jgi:acetyl-CoA carboxylase biotin carboxyl carrier protein
MNLKEIKDLINLMNENELIELEIEREGTKIRLKKSLSGKFEAITEGHEMPRIIQTIAPAKEIPSKTEEKEVKNLVPIKAPMVGTFYRAPAPEAKQYVEIGQVIEVGQVVCIIEAMKLMNEIKSEIKGKVVEVLVENAEPVEYGQALFMVEPV